jgi:hypothetical protein
VPEHDEEKTKRRDTFREPLGGPGSGVRRGLPEWKLEHEMRE